jgi:16S rRNA (cytosine1402-N4)-methyltransferase
MPPLHHQPVLLNETASFVSLVRSGIFLDATLGFGGHAEASLAANPALQLIGIDQDDEALNAAKERLGNQVEYLQGNFAEMDRLLAKIGIQSVDGILMDIGVSSWQLDRPERGFSYAADGPLDMRMDQSANLTAAGVVNSYVERQLGDLFFRYGEERFSRKIAKKIVETRRQIPLTRTSQLSELIVDCYPAALRHKRPHPATRIFQALRIEVNDELNALEQGMEAALKLLNPDGILVIITFHSLEDRLVKWRFRQASTEGFEVLTKKPLVAGSAELAANPRARSAKLRAMRRIESDARLR